MILICYFQTDAVIKAQALPRLQQLLHSSKNNLVKEASWAISNITAGTPEQIQKVISANLLGDIIEVLKKVRSHLLEWLLCSFVSDISLKIIGRF